MRIKIKCVTAILLFLLLQSCNDPEPKSQDFIGVWKSDDGSVIKLKEDRTFTAKQINYYNYDSQNEYENRRFDFEGRWKIVTQGKRVRLELNSDATFKDLGINKTYTVDGQVRSHKIGLSFEIAGEGPFENTLPGICLCG